MTTLKEEAIAYEAKGMKNVTDLDALSVSQEVFRETRKDREGSDYQVAFVRVDGVEYRIVNSVIEQIQNIIKLKPELKTVKVGKSGEGKATKYTVVALE